MTALRDVKKRRVNTKTKKSRVEARVTEAQKDLIELAASLKGKTVSEYVAETLYETAAETIREHETLDLHGRDREILLEALENPPAPTERAREAARHYKQVMGL